VQRDIRVCLSGVRPGFYETLSRVGIVEKLGADRVFHEVPQLWTSTASAVEWAHLQIDHSASGPAADRRSEAIAPWQFVI